MSKQQDTSKLWGGRFNEPTDSFVQRFTASVDFDHGAGLQGSIGQSNYAAAKAGIAALTLNQAAELARYGITANAITPAARTGMTTAVAEMAERMAKPEDGSFDYWAPENVSSCQLAMLQNLFTAGAVADIERPEFSVFGARLIETHLVDDLFQVLGIPSP